MPMTAETPDRALPMESQNRRRPFRAGWLAGMTALACALMCAPLSALAEEEAGQAAGAGSADTAAEASAGAGSAAPEVVYEKKTVLDFSDVTLEGSLTRPEGSYVLNRQRARFDSLVQTRKDFVPELQRSADEF